MLLYWGVQKKSLDWAWAREPTRILVVLIPSIPAFSSVSESSPMSLTVGTLCDGMSITDRALQRG